MKRSVGVCVLVAIAFGVIFLCNRGVDTLDAPALTLTVKVPPQLADASVSAWATRMEDPERETEFGYTSSVVLEQGLVDVASGQTGRGVLTWHELEPGRYMVSACFSPFQNYFRSVMVDVPASGVAVAEIELAEPEGSMWRRARVIGGDGKPVSNVRWFAEAWRGSSGTMRSEVGVMAEDGYYHVPIVDPVGMEGGTFTLEARSDAWGRQKVTYDPSSTDVIEFRYSTPVFVAGVIEGYAGSGYEGRLGVEVEARTDEPSRNWDEACTPVAADGSFVLPPRQPGKRQLVLYVRGVAPHPVAILHEEVVVVPGMDEVRVTLPALYQLTVIWPGAGARDVQVQSVDRADPTQAREAKHEGFAVIAALPAGRYSVRVGDEEVTVDVPAQSEVRFR